MTAVHGSVLPGRQPRGPSTTAICAVWHRDPKRRQLLASHAANLDRQTVPVHRVYVFDNADEIPPDLVGRTVVANRPLTIYQAWNLALALVETPYVMNLNLDDRLCVDAVARLEQALDQTGAALVGGDWLYCYDRPSTDATERAVPVDGIPICTQDSIRGKLPHRMGLGSRQAKTCGPACLWRVSLHRELGPYPDTFADGTAIKSIGDAIWWKRLSARKKMLARLDRIIGHYHYHPEQQAEFRHDGRAEWARYREIGCLPDL